MPLLTGTHTIDQLLAVDHLSVIEYGLENIARTFAADVAVHNAIVNDQVGMLCQRTTERGMVYGASASGEFIDADELSRAPGQLEGPGAAVDFPLEKKQYAIGWTADYFNEMTPADMARSQLAAQAADLRVIQKSIARAIYGATNYQTIDRQRDNYPLNVKRFVNADGAPIPNGDAGQEFVPGSHTHYDTAAALTATVLEDLITDVVEHGHGADVMVVINRGNEAAVKALTGFYPLIRADVNPGDNVARANGALDTSRTDSRTIGVFGAATIVTRPWAPLNYLFAFSAGDARKPLAMREPVQASLRGLRVAAENVAFPLQSRFMERRFGIGALTRTNGAVVQITGGAYTTPTI